MLTIHLAGTHISYRAMVGQTRFPGLIQSLIQFEKCVINAVEIPIFPHHRHRCSVSRTNVLQLTRAQIIFSRKYSDDMH